MLETVTSQLQQLLILPLLQRTISCSCLHQGVWQIFMHFYFNSDKQVAVKNTITRRSIIMIVLVTLNSGRAVKIFFVNTYGNKFEIILNQQLSFLHILSYTYRNKKVQFSMHYPMAVLAREKAPSSVFSCLLHLHCSFSVIYYFAVLCKEHTGCLSRSTILV